MRKKSSFTLTGLDGESAQIQLSKPTTVLSLLENHNVGIPDYAQFCLVVSKPQKNSMKVSFFEDYTDYISFYTKTIVFRRQPQSRVFCFTRQVDSQVWVKENPPTLIGMNLETRLRD